MQKAPPFGIYACLTPAESSTKHQSMLCSVLKRPKEKDLSGVMWGDVGGSTGHRISLSRGERPQPIERGSEPDDLADNDDCGGFDFWACGGDLA